MLQQLRSYLAASSVQAPEATDLSKPAAVLIALTDSPDNPSIVLTRRSQHLSSHSGEVSLPGGKWDFEDGSLETTALREAHEEIGLDPGLVEVLGALPVFQTWQGVEVTPIVGVVPETLNLTPNLDELDAIFQVPVQFFLDDQRLRTDIFERKIGHIWSPAYEFEGFEIWGFTARLLVNFIGEAFDAQIQRDNPAPVKDWTRR
ncbi:MAG: CoA pyrophosphatase [Cellvibrionaceae bacterium]